MRYSLARQPGAFLLLGAILYVLLLVPPVIAQRSSHPSGVLWERIDEGLISHAPVVALALDPEDPDRVLAGAYHDPGLYRSADGGRSWTANSLGLEGLSVFALEVDPTDPEVAYAGATNGLYRSMDGGGSWHPMRAGLPYIPVYALAIDRSGTLYVGTEGHGLYASSDGGRTLARVGEELMEKSVLSLSLDDSGGTMVAGTSGEGVYVSRDAGRSWQQVPQLQDSFVYYVVVEPESKSGFACSRDGLWQSDDGFQSWIRSETGFPDRVNVVVFHPEDSQIVYAGTARGNVLRSEDGGGTWSQTETLGRAIYAIAIHPKEPWRIYAGAWDGAYASSDGGLTWVQINAGLGSVPIDALALDTRDGGALYAGNTFDGVYVSQDDGASWERCAHGLQGPEGGGYGVLSLAVAESAPGLLYAGTDGSGVFWSVDGGETWSSTGPGLQVGIGAIVVDPGNARHLYIRAFYDRIYESTDGGVTWTARWEGMSDEEEILSLAMDVANPGTLYAGSEDGLYVTTEGATSWKEVGLRGRSVFSIAIDPQDRTLIYAGTTDALYRSHDRGLTWHPWGREMSGMTVSAVLADHRNPGVVYAGTKHHGFWWSRNGGLTWVPANQGLRSSSVNMLTIQPDGGVLYAATPDGLYRGLIQ